MRPRHAAEGTRVWTHSLNVLCLELVQGIIKHLSPLALVLLPGDVVSGLHFTCALAIIAARPFLLELLGSRRLCLLRSHIVAFSTSHARLFYVNWLPSALVMPG